MNNGLRVIAIDGPAGAGKSTVARALATRLGLEYLDTGAMYRAVTLAALQRGIRVTDEASVAELASNVRIELDGDRVLLDGEDATDAIRARDVTDAVSAVAAISAVRTEMVDRQRRWAQRRGGGVLEGRDIGTVVFPDAALKVYVTASPQVRAERRVAQVGGDVEQVAESIANRDRQDAGRSHGPLREADDALIVDSSSLTVEQVVDRIVASMG